MSAPTLETSADLVRLVEALGAGKRLKNYIIPGLFSTLLATPAVGGCVRLFEMTREQEYDITPHDHRYSFQCCVLSGTVDNRRYRTQATEYREMAGYVSLPYNPVTHALDEERPTWMHGQFTDEQFSEGDWYSMSKDEYHSIRFSKGAKVLFIEGPNEKEESACLLPYVNGRICNTFIWRDWMMEAA